MANTQSWHYDYERGRPGYPPEAVEIPGLASTAPVLELGAGTGKLTRLLTRAFASVTAVEPAPGMREVLVQTCSDAQVSDGSAEEIPLPDGSVAAVFVAEAFHWFDATRALPEIARVLRRDGALVLVWNVPAGPTEPSIEALERYVIEELGVDKSGLTYDPMDLNPRRYASGEWAAAFEGSPFGDFTELQLPNPQSVTPDELLAFLGSMGWLFDMPEPQRSSVFEDMRALLPAEKYVRPWETRVHWTRLRDHFANPS